MKKYFILLMTLLIVSISSLCSAGIMTDPIAVLPFGKKLTVASSLSIDDSEEAIQSLRDELELMHLNLADRTSIDQIITEHRFQQSDLVDPATAVQIGKLAGAKYIVVTNITDMESDGGTVYITVVSKIINVETGMIAASGRGEGKGNKISKALYKAAENAFNSPKGIAVKLGFKKR